jgi:hypothetical protein
LVVISGALNTNLKNYNLADMSTYNNSTVENLVKIEESLQNFVIKQTELKKEIKNFSKLNLYKFSKLADISRSSIFNSPQVLQIYSESRIQEINKSSKLILTSKTTSDSEFSKTQVNNIKSQLVSSYEYIKIIDELKDEIESLNKINVKLQNKLIKLSTLNNIQNPSPENIIQFNATTSNVD